MEEIKEEKSPAKKYPLGRAIVYTAFGTVCLFMLFVLVRAMVVGAFFEEQHQLENRVLTQEELIKCKTERAELYKDLHQQFSEKLATPNDPRTLKKFWKDWHQAWQKKLHDLDARCITAKTPGQQEMSRAMGEVDIGYELLMENYQDYLLSALLKLKKAEAVQAKEITEAPLAP